MSPPCPASLTLDILNGSAISKTEISDMRGILNHEPYNGSYEFAPPLYNHDQNAKHYGHLNNMHEVGVNTIKFHRVTSCMQSDWPKPYIEINSNSVEPS